MSVRANSTPGLASSSVVAKNFIDSRCSFAPVCCWSAGLGTLFKIMEKTQHVLMVGEGAQKFALDNGFKLESAKLTADHIDGKKTDVQ